MIQTLVIAAGIVISAAMIVYQRKSADERAEEHTKAQVDANVKRLTVNFIAEFEIHNEAWSNARSEAIKFLRTLSENDRQRIASGWSNRHLDDKSEKLGLNSVYTLAKSTRNSSNSDLQRVVS